MVVPLERRCGSTSVACCPGPTVKESELTWIRFDPTGFPAGGEVELDEEPPQPASEMVRAKIAARTHTWVEKRNGWGIFSLRLRNPLGLVPCSFEHDLRNWMRAQ